MNLFCNFTMGIRQIIIPLPEISIAKIIEYTGPGRIGLSLQIK